MSDSLPVREPPARVPRPRMRVLAIVVGGTLAGGAARATAPAAVLDGDPALVAELGQDLAARGIATGPAASAAVRVHVAREPQGIALDLSDPQGRMTARTVAGPDVAAAVIESWTRGELAEPLLAPRPPRAPEVLVVAPPPPEPPSRWQPTLRLDGSVSTDDGRGLWLGAAAGACRRIGGVCLGGEARLARRLDHDDTVSAGHLVYGRSTETDWQAMATAQVPIALGRPTLILGLGVGLERWSAGEAGVLGGRGEVRADLALPLWSSLALDVGLSAALAPQGDAGPFGDAAVTRQLRLGAGLRWGLP